jgi:hypothetical protein
LVHAKASFEAEGCMASGSLVHERERVIRDRIRSSGLMPRCYDVGVRTTVDIDEAVLQAARTLAKERRVSLGAALTELARRGLADREPTLLAGVPSFSVGEGAMPITPEMVREANEEQ